MAILQPSSSDTLNSPDHSLSHRVFANDSVAPVKSVVVDSAGLVGVGVEAPVSALHVVGAKVAGTNFNLTVFDSAALAADIGGGIGFGGIYTGTTSTAFSYIHGGKDNATDGNFDGYMRMFVRTTAGGFAEAMRITSAKRIGVGTTAPASSIFPTAAPLIDISSAAGAGLSGLVMHDLDSGQESAFGTNGANFVMAVAGHATATNNNITFQTEETNSQFSPTERMRIDSTGRVGIGTNSPTAVLHLKAGTATANTAPLKFTSGTLNTAAVAAQHEYDGEHRLTNDALLRFPVGGALFDHFADSSVGGAEADIYTDTLIANTFRTNGDKIIASYGGNFVTVGTESTQLKVYFAGTAIWDSAAVAPASGTTSWNVDVKLIRVSASIVRYTVSLNTNAGTGHTFAASGALSGLTLSGTNILKITGTSTGTGSGAGDIVGKMGYIMYSPAA